MKHSVSGPDVQQALFTLDTVDEVTAPDGCEGIWHRYVITQGTNTIVGMRSGQQSEVHTALLKLIDQLNLRFAKRPPR